jgi:hypothetical protein
MRGVLFLFLLLLAAVGAQVAPAKGSSVSALVATTTEEGAAPVAPVAVVPLAVVAPPSAVAAGPVILPTTTVSPAPVDPTAAVLPATPVNPANLAAVSGRVPTSGDFNYIPLVVVFSGAALSPALSVSHSPISTGRRCTCGCHWGVDPQLEPSLETRAVARFTEC